MDECFFVLMPLRPCHGNESKKSDRAVPSGAGKKIELVTRNVLESNIYSHFIGVISRLRKAYPRTGEDQQ